jgi:glycosyltransferase involved in cell wall biosynthesis
MDEPSDISTDWAFQMRDLVQTLHTHGILRVESFAWRDLADPDAGGSEVHADHVMTRWAQAGLDLSHRTSTDGQSETFTRNGYTVTRRGGRYSVFLSVITARLLRRAKRDVAIVEIWNGVPWFSQLWGNKVRTTWLHHIHEDMWNESLPRLLAPIARWVEIWLAPKFYRHTRIATLATTTRDELISRGYRANHVVVAEPGIDPRYCPRNNAKTPSPTLLAVGRLAPVKRFPLLLETFAEVLRSFPDAHLTIAGDGPDKDVLLHAIERLHLTGHVTLAGRVSDEELLELYQSSWLLVSASHSEGWGMTITEAAACGTPCVVTANHGHCAAATHNVTGLIVEDDTELSAAMIRVLTDDALRNTLTHGALTHAAKFQWDRTATILLQTLVDSLPHQKHRS